MLDQPQASSRVTNSGGDEMTIPKGSPQRIDELDGLRGLLALWVALSHIFCLCGCSQLPFSVPRLAYHSASLLWVQYSFAGGAVDTFIILSGFAICYLLHARPQTYGQFLTGRIFRLYPVYLLCLLAGFTSVYALPLILRTASWHNDEYLILYVYPGLHSALTHPLAHLAAHLSLLFGLIPEKIFLANASATLLPPAWSISLEWQFYLVAPFLIRYACKPAGLLVLGLISAFGYVYSHFWGSAFLPAMLPLFLIGIGSYHLYVHADALRRNPHRPLILAGLVGLTIITGWHWVSLLVWLAVFGSVLANHDAPAEKPLLRLRQALLCPPLQFLGKISYPLYLIHWPVILALLAALLCLQPQISDRAALLLLLFAGVPIILAGAWLLHLAVEKPFMRLGRHFAK